MPLTTLNALEKSSAKEFREFKEIKEFRVKSIPNFSKLPNLSNLPFKCRYLRPSSDLVGVIVAKFCRWGNG